VLRSLPIVELEALKMGHRESILSALDYFESNNLDFEDCLAIAHALRANDGRVYSYDLDFDKVKDITRLEP
jgi:predicted nucleic acid-binding protein